MMGNSKNPAEDVCKDIDEALDGLVDVMRHELLVNYKSEQAIRNAARILVALKSNGKKSRG